MDLLDSVTREDSISLIRAPRPGESKCIAIHSFFYHLHTKFVCWLLVLSLSLSLSLSFYSTHHTSHQMLYTLFTIFSQNGMMTFSSLILQRTAQLLSKE